MKIHLDNLIAELEEKKRRNIATEGEIVYLNDLKATRLDLYGEKELIPLSPITLDTSKENIRCKLHRIQHLITYPERNLILEYAKNTLEPSDVVGVNNQVRTSWETGLKESQLQSDELNAAIRSVKAKIAQFTNIPESHQETLTIIRYRQYEEYKRHHDFFTNAEVDIQHILQNGGDRIATVLICLQEPEEGGETNFPLLDITLKQEVCSATIWLNGAPDGSELYQETEHAGLPVLKGEKWMMTCWIRQNPILPV